MLWKGWAYCCSQMLLRPVGLYVSLLFMQRANCISLIWVLVLCLFGAGSVPAVDSARQAKAEIAAKKAAAAKAVATARAAAKVVQKAQDAAAEKRVKADKLVELAALDKAKLTAALGRNANQKTLEKLTQAAHKSAETARIAQEDADKAAADVQSAMVAARQAEVREREAFEALDSTSPPSQTAPASATASTPSQIAPPSATTSPAAAASVLAK